MIVVIIGILFFLLFLWWILKLFQACEEECQEMERNAGVGKYNPLFNAAKKVVENQKIVEKLIKNKKHKTNA